MEVNIILIFSYWMVIEYDISFYHIDILNELLSDSLSRVIIFPTQGNYNSLAIFTGNFIINL